MGFLDRWIKKKTKDQLAKGRPGVKVEEPAVSAKVENPAAAISVEGKNTGEASLAYRVIIRPLITEKSATRESENQYIFVVARSAKKLQVKRAVKALYGVDAVSVNIVNVEGRRLRFGRSAGRRSDYKKAIVTLPKGKSITVHEGV